VWLAAVVQKLCGLLLFRDKDVHYSRSCYWLPLLIGIPYALAGLSRMSALYYGKYFTFVLWSDNANLYHHHHRSA